MKSKSTQTGFTLIEISIVLVIIGLLLGGVLKGQELISSAKVKNLAQDFRSIQTAFYTYQDKFHALPGDDGRAITHLCPSTAPGCTTNGDSNGKIDGDWDAAATTTVESIYFWQHIRLANLASGPTDTASPTFEPLNSEGGRIGIQSGGAPLGITDAHIICSAGIPGKFVRQLDEMLDDGNPETGSVRAGITSTGPAATAIDNGEVYVVCQGF